jgi:dihydroorotate dehydrogenase electron transfer subunit
VTTAIHPVIERVQVAANARIAPGVGLISLHAPLCARSVKPGQFVHLRLGAGTDTILRRPFSIHRAYDATIEILYQVLGAGTLRLAEKMPGDDSMDLVGPLGHGWNVPTDMTHALLVGGGLGAAPLGMLAEQLASMGVAAVVAQGAPTAERLVARQLFERVTRRVDLATDDGSAGERGFVTSVTERLLDTEHFDMVYICGPEVMERAVIGQCAQRAVPCQVSLERLMACGIGACLSCVVSTRSGLKRACVDGPVFNAEEVLFDASEIPPKH